MLKNNEVVGEKNNLNNFGGGGVWFFRLFTKNSCVNLLGSFYQKLPMVLKNIIFGVKIKHL